MESLTDLNFILMDNDFLNFAWCSLTTEQQNIIEVKYHISKSNKPLNDLIEDLECNFNFYRSECRIRKMRKYEIPLIIERLSE